ncbi:MAG: hemolysin III family protein [Eubacteriaceae bacterium]|nr:hemolysin III family protein [Eubacteriaceae bacterium]
MKLNIREPINTITHFVGLVLSFLGFFILLTKSIMAKDLLYLLSSIIFSLGLVGLYFASSLYHFKVSSAKVLTRLRKFDHMMIFVLIAGTYTPICLITLKGMVGYTLLGIIWGLAAIGMTIKLFFINVPRWFSTGIYLFLGWASLSVVKPLAAHLPAAGMALLVSGGLFYTVGAIIYGTKNPRIKIGKFGFHEIFHVFILLGSLMHYLLISIYIISL